MNSFLFALVLAAGAPDDVELPRSLAADETSFIVAEPAPLPDPKEKYDIWVGGHLGVAGAYDGSPTFLIGAMGRSQILPWLGVEASIDFQLKQDVEHTNADIFQVPFMFTALFFPPLDLAFRPYGLATVGFTITNVSAPGFDDTSVNALFGIGFGVEYDLSPTVMLDANVRFIFAQDPPHHGDFSADWAQFTVGVLFKLVK